ncbi:MAG: SoxXA-binding protein [Gammaproteobacteria bacterium]|nr:SoxXA-binding protein [Gammaproteobacteria bacterium]
MKKLAVIATALMLFGCATTEPKMEQTADYPTLVKQAEASIKKAKSVGSEWRDSEKFLKNAEKAAKAGDMDKAMKLAKKAKAEGELGYKQGESQKNAGPWLF